MHILAQIEERALMLKRPLLNRMDINAIILQLYKEHQVLIALPFMPSPRVITLTGRLGVLYG